MVFLLVNIFPAQLLRLFDNNPELIEAGIVYIKTFSFDYLFVPLMAGLNGLFIGSGHTTFSLINGMTSALLVRIPTCYIFGIMLDMGLSGVGLGAPCASFVAFAIGLIYYMSGKWKENKIIQHRH